MKHAIPAALLVLALGAFAARAQDPPAPDKPAEPAKGAADKPPGELDTLEKKVGYRIGLNIGRSLKQEDASVDIDAVTRGIKDGLAGTAPIMSENALDEAMREFQMKLQAASKKRAEEAAMKNKTEGAAFLEKNKTAEGVATTPSGLQYKMVKAGNGEKPAPTDVVTVNYEGTLTDGRVFDSSYERGKPATFPLNRVIKGWTEGLQLMDVGSTYMLYIPSELAYGENPRPGGIITPHAVLVFKVELLKIEKK